MMLPLRTERLALRQVTYDDASFVLELINDPEWIRNISDRGIRTVEAVRGYIDEVLLASYAKHGFGLYRIGRRADDVPIGMCGLIRRDTLPDVDIGYALLPAYRGQGYALEAAQAVLEHGRRDHGLKRLLGIASASNLGSRRILERLGLVYQGMREDTGFAEPSCLYAIEFTDTGAAIC
ncbi:GNAT family N-acetyltransferase [Chitinimonas sp.]|uniref:GNAT family N-acetyltransferase n=1 Tax=Chitinimonas sp. TaxID=1934313 RepID=UPI0035AE8DB8